SPAKVSSTSRAVLTSLKPSSGCFRIRSPSPTISSARRSMAAYTRSFSSFFVMEAPFRRYSTRHGLPPRRRGGRRHRAGPDLLLLHLALVRRAGVGFRHSLALAIVVYAITWGTFLILGRRGAALFAPVWLHTLVLYVVGIGLVARLFGDVVAGRAAEAARRDAAQLRAVTLLARAAAHEINNPLTAVLGGLGLAARKLMPDSEEAKWIDRGREGGRR